MIVPIIGIANHDLRHLNLAHFFTLSLTLLRFRFRKSDDSRESAQQGGGAATESRKGYSGQGQGGLEDDSADKYGLGREPFQQIKHEVNRRSLTNGMIHWHAEASRRGH